MEKDFYEWHKIKTRIHSVDSNSIYFKERDIWWCHLGMNVGLEQNGKDASFARPVLIFKKFNRRICWVIPLSTQIKKGSFFFPLLSEVNVIRMAILPQMKLMDSKRLIKKTDRISKNELLLIQEKIIACIR